jgi:large subunit ribosomal protein L15
MTAKDAIKTLGNLSPAKGSNLKKKRLGRGTGSGLGKTAARGGKGQTARKGGGIRAGFEGGQTPLYRRLPKRGFTNPFRVDFNCVNLSALNKFSEGATVDAVALEKAGLLRFKGLPVKVLAKGELKQKLNLVVDKISAAAQAAVTKSGGTVKIQEAAAK